MTTITSLRAMTAPSASVMYYVQDAGREGFFRYDAADVASADNNGTIIVSGNGKRFKRIFERHVNPKWWGAAGDNYTTDDAVALQACFDYASTYGYDIEITGKHKTTVPLQIREYYEGVTQHFKKHPCIRGIGFTQHTGETWDVSGIKGYDIDDDRSVLELIGWDNSAVNASTIENLVIRQDTATCGDKSSCLSVGDSRFFRATKIKLEGKNALNLIAKGGQASATSYAMINSQFNQCIFIATSDTGWSVKTPPIEGYVGSPWDNIKFDNCFFGGTTFVYAYLANFDNCMWSLPARRDKVTFTAGVLDDIEVDFSAGVIVGAATNVSFNKCYFEDYRVGILIDPVQTIGIVNIENSYFNGRTNQTEEGDPIMVDAGILIRKTKSVVHLVNIVAPTFRRFDPFGHPGVDFFPDDNMVINHGATNLIIEKPDVYYTAGNLAYTDTWATGGYVTDLSNGYQITPTIAEIDGLQDELDLLAPKADPTFSGVVGNPSGTFRSTTGGLANTSTSNNAFVQVLGNGVWLSRNIADSTAAATTKQTHASSTGNIHNFENSTGLRVKITKDGDVELMDSAIGVVLKAPDGTRYRITVANDGALTTTAL